MIGSNRSIIMSEDNIMATYYLLAVATVVGD